MKKFARLETQGKKARLAISPDLCKGCGLCVEKCPSQVLDWSDILGIYGTAIVEPKRIERCTGCGLCQLFCPDSAIDVIRESADYELERKRKGADLQDATKV
ncbi:MAG TPA: 4Fe-4S dicluster domain-containing protein [Firmicutes bacterium]|nr:4Fe-4S dicluster domain-containing protein [Bacillota bacterium]